MVVYKYQIQQSGFSLNLGFCFASSVNTHTLIQSTCFNQEVLAGQEKDAILVKSLGTLNTFPNIWSFCPPPPPLPQHNVDVSPSKVDPLFQNFFRGEGSSANLIMTSLFKIMCHHLEFCHVFHGLLLSIVGLIAQGKQIFLLGK